MVPQKALVACSHSSTKETRNTAVQELSEAFAGAQQLRVMTQISNGVTVQVAFYATVAIQMVTAAIFHSHMAVKCTRLVQLKTKPGPGVPLLTTMTWISCGVIVEVRKPNFHILHNVFRIFAKTQRILYFRNFCIK